MDMTGKMRNRITVQAQTIERGPEGGEIPTWTDSFSAFAAVKVTTVGSDERISSNQLVGRTSVQFTIRKERRSVLTRNRVVFDGLIYEIDSVLPSGNMLEYLILECLQTGEQKTA